MALVPAGGHGVMLWAPACRAAKQNFGPDLTKHPPDRLPGRRSVRPLRDLITFRAAGRELGRCNVERRTPSATAGRDHQEHRRPDAGDAFYARRRPRRQWSC
jgi:hypothetical protein